MLTALLIKNLHDFTGQIVSVRGRSYGLRVRLGLSGVDCFSESATQQIFQQYEFKFIVQLGHNWRPNYFYMSSSMIGNPSKSMIA
jgi:hypothetical protein